MREEIEVKIYVTTTEYVVVKGSRDAVERHVRFIELHRDLAMDVRSRAALVRDMLPAEQQWYHRGFIDGSQHGCEGALNTVLTPPRLLAVPCVKCGYQPEILTTSGAVPSQTCGHFNLAPYGCESCFMSHEEIAAEKLAQQTRSDA